MNSSTRNTLLFFIILGAVLRIYQIAFQCPWLEEQYTINMVGPDWISMLHTSVFVDYTPPSYYILAKLSFIACQDWWAIRIPSLIAGVLLIPAMYLLGKTYKDEITGAWCAGITSILFPMVYYSQYGRAYALLHLFFALFLVCYIKEVRSGNSGMLMWVFGALCIWTHLYSAIPAMILIALTFRPNHQWVKNALLFAGITLPLMVAMFLSAVRTRSIGVGYGDSPLVLLLTTPGEIFGVLFVLLGIFLLIGFLVSECKEVILARNSMGVVAVVTILAGFLLSTTTPVFPRYYAATAGLILLLIACGGISKTCEIILAGLGYVYTPDNIRIVSVASVIVVVILLALQFGDFSVYYTTQKYICDTLPLLPSPLLPT